MDDMTETASADSLSGARMEAELTIRRLFDEWCDASTSKDLDRSMAPIASSIVSYEHSSPLQYDDIDQIREECRRGFERAADDFRWTVPDLAVIVDGDLAVTWGLNRMADRLADGSEEVTWSRGTRVFQRSNGRWMMTHQHVSFPIDPTTGIAAMDLTP